MSTATNSSIFFDTVDCCSKMISFKMHCGNSAWLCMPTRFLLLEKGLGKGFVMVRCNFQIPWIVLGDFNEIISPSEVRGVVLSSASIYFL